MNKRLLEALRQGMSSDQRQVVATLIAMSGAAESELVQEIEDTETAKVMNVAAGFISNATARLVRREPTFEHMAAATTIVTGLDEIMKNPAVLNYTQAVMLLTVALLSEPEEEGEQT